MRHAVRAQMFAHGNAGLPAAHDQRIYLLNRHAILHRERAMIADDVAGCTRARQYRGD